MNHTGGCVDEQELIDLSCPNGEGGKYIEKLKIVECNKIVDPEEVCDSACQSTKSTAYLNSDGDIIVDEDEANKFDITEYESTVFGRFECKMPSG